MRDRADEPPVLQDGAAAHALHDAAGLRQQGVVRDGQPEVAPLRLVRLDGDDLHGIFARLRAGNVGEDRRAAGVDLCGGGRGQRRNVLRRCHDAKNAALRVAADRPARAAPRHGAVQRAGRSDLAARDRCDGGGQGKAAAQREQGAAVADTVAECAERAVLRVIIGDGADAGDAVTDKHAEPPAVRGSLGLHGCFGCLAAALIADGQRLPVRGGDGCRDLPDRADPLAVNGADDVTAPQPCLPRAGVVLRQLHDGNAVRLQLQADGLPAGDEPIRQRRQRRARQKHERQQDGCQLLENSIHFFVLPRFSRC